MSQTRNVDDLIVKVQNEQTGVTTPPPSEPVPVEFVPETDSAVDVAAPEVAESEGYDIEVSESPKEETKAEDDRPASDSVAESPIDEYGNPVEKPKTYTEEEVQRMIRDRLSRGRHAELQTQPTQHTHQQTQQTATDGFQADPNSEDSWEIQLEQFIEKTIEKRTARQTEQQWRQQEAQRQADFESKFSTGMNKYQDFHQVVANKPITDSMMIATRNLENPAAFVYAACKMHPGELERISRIPDSSAQMMEIGRLDATMRKQHTQVSNAPKPVSAVKGDLPVKQNYQPSIEDRIHQYGKQKVARR